MKRGIKKKIEEILGVEYLSPHAPPPGVDFKRPRCGDCFCTDQTVHTHSTNQHLVKPILEILVKNVA